MIFFLMTKLLSEVAEVHFSNEMFNMYYIFFNNKLILSVKQLPGKITQTLLNHFSIAEINQNKFIQCFCCVLPYVIRQMINVKDKEVR